MQQARTHGTRRKGSYLVYDFSLRFFSLYITAGPLVTGLPTQRELSISVWLSSMLRVAASLSTILFFSLPSSLCMTAIRNKFRMLYEFLHFQLVYTLFHVVGHFQYGALAFLL